MESVLKKYFGFSQFRPYQKDVIGNILDGRDCLVVMATGSGKSLCYQVPPLVTGKTAVIISPLLSLMQDQVMTLKQRGIKAEYLGSTQSDKAAYSEAESGKFKILYMTPEKACSLPSRFWVNLLNVGICLLAIDEAHCISEWGHSFRREYKQLHMLHCFLSDVPFVGLTATATEKVRKDIVDSLKMSDPYIAIGSFDRQNLFYGVKSFNRSVSILDELVAEVLQSISSVGSTIIYCTTVRDTEQISEALRHAGIKTGTYHGQMGSKAREESHRSFITDELNVMVATIAFGMGIDKPNVRCVIHYGCPKSLESYYQESGRCGRDGLASVCWLYYQRSDFGKADFYCAEAQSENQRKAIMESFISAQRYCLLATCRRKFLLQYFGEETTASCGKCDNCTGSRTERDLSKESFLLLSCTQSCGGRWGVNMPVDVLRGSRSKKIVDNQFDKLPLHGLGRGYSAIWWKSLAGLLIADGYLREIIEDVYRCVSVSPSGKQFLCSYQKSNQPSLVLALTSEMIAEEEGGGSHEKVEGNVQDLTTALEFEGFTEAETELFHMLIDSRKKLANDTGTAPYAICGDETIKMMAKIRPSTKVRLANIDGVNQHLVTKYGEILIQYISQFSQGLSLPLDGPATVRTAVTKKVHANSNKPVAPAKLDAWQQWEMDKLSFQHIANRPGKMIKESTVISYILEAALDGYDISWARFCQEIGLTLAIASQVRTAILKVGSRDRLKPIKEELPENVTYEQIRTFLAMEKLGLSVEENCTPCISSEGPTGTSELHSNNQLVKGEEECDPMRDEAASCSPGEFVNSPDTSLAPKNSGTVVAGMKQPRSDDSLHHESSTKKFHKCSEVEDKTVDALEATEDTILDWVGEHDSVQLADVVEHFKGSSREFVVELLGRLEGEFLIFKKNGFYQVM